MAGAQPLPRAGGVLERAGTASPGRRAGGSAMSQQSVERTLGKLLTDESFRERFFAVPELATWELGLQLSALELEALSGISQAGILHVAAQLDKRICRVPLDRPSGHLERSVRTAFGSFIEPTSA
jgi:hypothetical protein